MYIGISLLMHACMLIRITVQVQLISIRMQLTTDSNCLSTSFSKYFPAQISQPPTNETLLLDITQQQQQQPIDTHTTLQKKHYHRDTQLQESISGICQILEETVLGRATDVEMFDIWRGVLGTLKELERKVERMQSNAGKMESTSNKANNMNTNLNNSMNTHNNSMINNMQHKESIASSSSQQHLLSRMELLLSRKEKEDLLMRNDRLEEQVSKLKGQNRKLQAENEKNKQLIKQLRRSNARLNNIVRSYNNSNTNNNFNLKDTSIILKETTNTQQTPIGKSAQKPNKPELHSTASFNRLSPTPKQPRTSRSPLTRNNSMREKQMIREMYERKWAQEQIENKGASISMPITPADRSTLTAIRQHDYQMFGDLKAKINAYKMECNSTQSNQHPIQRNPIRNYKKHPQDHSYYQANTNYKTQTTYKAYDICHTPVYEHQSSQSESPSSYKFNAVPSYTFKHFSSVTCQCDNCLDGTGACLLKPLPMQPTIQRQPQSHKMKKTISSSTSNTRPPTSLSHQYHQPQEEDMDVRQMLNRMEEASSKKSKRKR